MAEMTAAHVARRTDRLGVHSLDHIAIAVPDLTVAHHFYKAFGLDFRRAAAGLELRAFGNEHVWATIAPAPAKRVAHVSFGAFEHEIERIAGRLVDPGVPVSPSAGQVSRNGIWFHDPNGMLVEVRAAPKVAPDEKLDAIMRSCPAGERGAAMRGIERDDANPRQIA